MGRSLRRVKRSKPKIIKRKKKSPFAKSKVPHELTRDSTQLEDKLGEEWTHEWDETRHLNENYEESGFVMDPNEGHGRKTRGGIRVSEADLKTDEELDDDLRRTLGKESLIHGKAAPKRPTDRQRKIIEDLQRAHGDDVRSMAMDHKRNKMQLSAGVLSELIRACQYWPKGSGVDFRVPNKKLWSN